MRKERKKVDLNEWKAKISFKNYYKDGVILQKQPQGTDM